MGRVCGVVGFSVVEIQQAFARGMTAEQICERYGVPFKKVQAVWDAMQKLIDEDEQGAA